MGNRNEELLAQNQLQKSNFDWSFKPFLIFIKILTGVDLSITKAYNKKYWFLSIRASRAYLMFLLNLVVNVMWDIEMIMSIFPTQIDNNETDSDYNGTALESSDLDDSSFTLREIMEYITSNIYYLGIHFAFLLATFCNTRNSPWACLWAQIYSIQKECELNVYDQYWKFRRIVIFGMTCILMVSLNLCCIQVNCF